MSMANTEHGKVKHKYTHMFYRVDCTRDEYVKLNSIDKPFGGWKPELVATVLHEIRGQVGVTGKTGLSDPELGLIEPKVANSVEATLAQRGSRYGDFTDHARLCQQLKYYMVESRVTNADGSFTQNWNNLTSVQKQALEVIVDKIARILTGDPNYDDNWHDIQGYAKLVEDRLPCNVNKETK